MSKFAIGDLAVENKSIKPGSGLLVYKVIALLDENFLVEYYGDTYNGVIHALKEEWISKPGDRDWREGLQRFMEDELLSPAEAVDQMCHLEAIRDKLNEDFNLVRAEVQAKLDQAATLVTEAADIVISFDKEFLDMKQECMPLHLALDKGGWRQSRMTC